MCGTDGWWLVLFRNVAVTQAFMLLYSALQSVSDLSKLPSLQLSCALPCGTEGGTLTLLSFYGASPRNILDRQLKARPGCALVRLSARFPEKLGVFDQCENTTRSSRGGSDVWQLCFRDLRVRSAIYCSGTVCFDCGTDICFQRSMRLA